MGARMPALFAGHGSPMNAVEDTAFRRAWQVLGRRLPEPRAVLCISAHWETRGVHVGAAARPDTVHDFGGFPRELHEMQYPAPGAPALAEQVCALLGAEVRVDEARGLDHGAWSVLSAMYPAANVPVAQLSLDATRDSRGHYASGARLAPLREEGVLILGSGNIVHNLALWNRRDPTPCDWARDFDAAVVERIRAGDHQGLIDWPALPGAALAVPTPEHFLPLLYVLAVQRAGEEAAIFNQAVESSLSMTSVLLGADAGHVLQAHNPL